MDLPIVGTVPRSGTWRLRYIIAFLFHLDRVGRIDDPVTGEVVGLRLDKPFDFERFRGGPLFRVAGTLPVEHLFIGHAICPGFMRVADRFPQWSRLKFHVPGYDYVHDGLDYSHTPVDLANREYIPLSVDLVDRHAVTDSGPPLAFFYRNPLDQAQSYYRYCQEHHYPIYNSLDGMPLGAIDFRTYLFSFALQSYAKQFLSYQLMMDIARDRLKLFTFERLSEAPYETVRELLVHLSRGARRHWPNLEHAIRLTGVDRVKAFEARLGRPISVDETNKKSHMWEGEPDSASADAALRAEAIERLAEMGVNTSLIEWPSDSSDACALAAL